MASRKLERQLSKIFDIDEFDGELKRLSDFLKSQNDTAGELSKVAAILDNTPAFVQWVDDQFHHMEERVELATRSLDLATKEQFAVNQQIEAMLNSLGEGYLVFSPDGICFPNYSKACEEIFGFSPAAKHISDILKIPAERKEAFNTWLNLLFKEAIDFDDLTAIGPKVLAGTKDRYVTLRFKPLRNETGAIEKMVLVATDRTEERKAQLEAERNREYAEMIVKITRNKNQFVGMVQDLQKFMVRLDEIARMSGALDMEAVTETARVVHTAKGAAASFSLSELRDYIHDFETSIDGFKKGKDTNFEALRGKLTDFTKVFRSKLAMLLKSHEHILGKEVGQAGRTREIKLTSLYSFINLLNQGADMQQVMRHFIGRVLSVPVHQSFVSFDLVVQSAAEKLFKRMHAIEFKGEDFPIFQEVYEEVFSSLVHVFRNAVDHGIEAPDEREISGKDAYGRIQVETRKVPLGEGTGLQIEIRDDGRGVDVERLKAKLKKNGLKVDGLSDSDIVQHIFDSGLSTRDEVTDLSGRGVGLDVVKVAVERMGGAVHAESVQGKGMTIRIQLPYLDKVTPQLMRILYPKMEEAAV